MVSQCEIHTRCQDLREGVHLDPIVADFSMILGTVVPMNELPRVGGVQKQFSMGNYPLEQLYLARKKKKVTPTHFPLPHITFLNRL